MATQPPWDQIGSVPIYLYPDNSFGWLVGGDIDGDGSGRNLENDPDFQPTTTLKHADGTYINSRLEKGVVIPERIALRIPGIVMGCQAKVTNVISGLVTPAVCHDTGPNDKIGEYSIALAAFMQENSNPISGGTQVPKFFVQIFPGVAAYANGQQYQLQPL